MNGRTARRSRLYRKFEPSRSYVSTPVFPMDANRNAGEERNPLRSPGVPRFRLCRMSGRIRRKTLRKRVNTGKSLPDRFPKRHQFHVGALDMAGVIFDFGLGR